MILHHTTVVIATAMATVASCRQVAASFAFLLHQPFRPYQVATTRTISRHDLRNIGFPIQNELSNEGFPTPSSLNHRQDQEVESSSPLHMQKKQEEHVYIACYKPALMLCSWNSNEEERAKRKHRASPRTTLADFSFFNTTTTNSSSRSPLHTVGRLDRDSEGLLLITTDGAFTAAVLEGSSSRNNNAEKSSTAPIAKDRTVKTSPNISSSCPKTYWALVQGQPNQTALEQMRAGGLRIRGAVTRPPLEVKKVALPSIAVDAVSKEQPLTLSPEQLLPPPAFGMEEARINSRNRNSNNPNNKSGSAGCCWLQITLTEGKIRQCRKITATAGHKTVRLIRVATGACRLLDDDDRGAVSYSKIGSTSVGRELLEKTKRSPADQFNSWWIPIDPREVLPHYGCTDDSGD